MGIALLGVSISGCSPAVPRGQPLSAPANISLPAISGDADIGSTLTLTSPGAWTGNPGPTLARQWRVNGEDASGQTGTTFDTTGLDAADAVTCRVTATNSEGSAFADSNVIELHATLSPPVALDAIAPLRVQQQTGVVTLATAAHFSGATSYALTGSPPAGVSINTGTGVVSVDTDVLTRRLSTALTVRASNADGSADQAVALSCGPRMGISIPTGDASGWNGTQRDLVLGKCAAAQMSFVRLDFDWNHIQTGASTWSWTLMDDLVSRCGTAGMEVLGILKNSATYAGAAWNDLPAEPAAFQAFCAAAAARYPQILLWEIWNEPNADFAIPHDNGSLYAARALGPGYEGVKAGNPSAQIIAGGLVNKRTGGGDDALAFFSAMMGRGELIDHEAPHMGVATEDWYGAFEVTTPEPGTVRIHNRAADWSGSGIEFDTVVGKAYRVRVSALGGTAGGRVVVSDASGDLLNLYGPGTMDQVFVARHTTTELYLSVNTQVDGNYSDFSGLSFWEADAYTSCDFYADHPYIDTVWPHTALWGDTASWMGTQITRDMQAAAVSAGKVRPWFTTEFGGATQGTNGDDRTPMTEADQAAMFLEAFDRGCSGEAWRYGVAVYTAVDRGGATDDCENWFGICGPIAGGAAVKPATATLATIKRGVR